MKKFNIYFSRFPYYLRLIKSRIFLYFNLFKKNNTNDELIYNQFFIDKKLKELKSEGYCTLELSDIINEKEKLEILDFIKEAQNKEINTYEKSFLNNFIGGDFLKNKKFNFDYQIPLSR